VLTEALVRTFRDVLHTGTADFDHWPGLKAEMDQGLAAAAAAAGAGVVGAPPSPPTAARDLSTYAGTYEHSYYGRITVAVSGAQLVMTRGVSTTTVPLTHWDADVFSVSREISMGTDGQVPVRFTVSPAGVAQSVEVSYLHEISPAPTFARAP
jgi:hypothetical protein